jgi:7,8-dihydroneopterin aldolase/epimerase/oxygenase
VTDRILLQGLTFYGYHGARPEEKRLGQRFVVDLTLRLDLAPAGRADDLGQSIDYGQAYELVRECIEGPSRDTLEAVAEEVAARLLERFARLEAVVVRVVKPAAPIAGAHFRRVAVEICRGRGGGAG